jgi:hypothetical protein
MSWRCRSVIEHFAGVGKFLHCKQKKQKKKEEKDFLKNESLNF